MMPITRFENGLYSDLPPRILRTLVNSLAAIYYDVGAFKMKCPLRDMVEVEGLIAPDEFVSIIRYLIDTFNWELIPFELTASYHIFKREYAWFNIKVEPTGWFLDRKFSRKQRNPMIPEYAHISPGPSSVGSSLDEAPQIQERESPDYTVISYSYFKVIMSYGSETHEANTLMSDEESGEANYEITDEEFDRMLAIPGPSGFQQNATSLEDHTSEPGSSINELNDNLRSLSISSEESDAEEIVGSLDMELDTIIRKKLNELKSLMARASDTESLRTKLNARDQERKPKSDVKVNNDSNEPSSSTRSSDDIPGFWKIRRKVEEQGESGSASSQTQRKMDNPPQDLARCFPIETQESESDDDSYDEQPSGSSRMSIGEKSPRSNYQGSGAADIKSLRIKQIARDKERNPKSDVKVNHDSNEPSSSTRSSDDIPGFWKIRRKVEEQGESGSASSQTQRKMDNPPQVLARCFPIKTQESESDDDSYDEQPSGSSRMSIGEKSPRSNYQGSGAADIKSLRIKQNARDQERKPKSDVKVNHDSNEPSSSTRSSDDIPGFWKIRRRVEEQGESGSASSQTQRKMDNPPQDLARCFPIETQESESEDDSFDQQPSSSSRMSIGGKAPRSIDDGSGAGRNL